MAVHGSVCNPAAAAPLYTDTSVSCKSVRKAKVFKETGEWGLKKGEVRNSLQLAAKGGRW